MAGIRRFPRRRVVVAIVVAILALAAAGFVLAQIGGGRGVTKLF